MARAWVFLLSRDKARFYGARVRPGGVQYAATITDVACLALLFWIVRLGVARIEKVHPLLVHISGWLALAAITATCAYVAHASSRSVRRWRRAVWTNHRRTFLVTIGLCLVSAPSVASAFGVPPWEIVDNGLLGLFPLTLYTLVSSLRLIVGSSWHGKSVADPVTSAAAPASASPQRVLWLIFDELDARLLEMAPSLGVPLPVMERIMKQSFDSRNTEPAAPFTELALPILLTGQEFTGSFPRSETHLQLRRLHDRELVDWPDVPSVFDQVRERGWAASLIGWYHPYPAIFGHVVDVCAWWPSQVQWIAVGRQFSTIVVRQLRACFETRRYSPFGQSLTVKEAVQDHCDFRLAALDAAANRQHSLAVVHWPLPHAPYFYDRERADFSAANQGPRGYLSQLALFDQCLGELVEAAEVAAGENPLAVLISSDHPWRSSRDFDGGFENRIPFLVYFPREPWRVESSTHFNARNSKALVLELLNGTITTPGDVERFICARAGA